MKNEADFGKRPYKGKGRKVLIVDDDYYFRLILKNNLTTNQYQPQCAESAKHAQYFLGLEKFDLVISDIEMPGSTGLDLLRWIKVNHPMPVILTTGLSEILETQEGHKLGADGFLAKPFKEEDLLSAIASCFPQDLDEQAKQKNLDPDFCKISINDFISGREMKFDIFIRTSETKYIKIAHCGEDISLDRIESYRKKNVPFLYMRKDDFKKYLDFNLFLVRSVAKSDRINHLKKVNFIKHTSEIFLQNLSTEGISEENFLQAKAIVENAIAILSDSPGAADLLIALSSHTDYLYAHSVGVSLFSSLIAGALGWTSPSTIFRVSVGGLLHDVGKKEIPIEILSQPRRALTPSDIARIETHPARGAEILAQLQSVPSDILQIVHEHHENCLGTGYPAHLKRTKIHPFARVVHVADDFCNLVLKNPNSNGMDPKTAIRQMLALNLDYYDPAALTALMKVVGVSEIGTNSIRKRERGK